MFIRWHVLINYTIDNTYNNKTPPINATHMIARIAISISTELESSVVVWNI